MAIAVAPDTACFNNFINSQPYLVADYGVGKKAPPYITGREYAQQEPELLPLDCFVCGRKILGSSYTCFGHRVHAHCLQCSTCGTDLSGMNQQREERPRAKLLLINEKFYCQLHGEQRKQLLAGICISDDDDDVGMKKSTHGKLCERGRGVGEKKTDNNGAAMRLQHPNRHQPRESPQHSSTKAIHQRQRPNRLIDGNNSTACWASGKLPPPAKSPRPPAAHLPYKPDAVPSFVDGGKSISTELNRILQRKLEKDREEAWGKKRLGLGEKPIAPSVLKSKHNQPPPPLLSQRSAPSRNYENRSRSAEERPICEFCRDEISGPYVMVSGRCWCPEHFTCANSACGRRLLGCGFIQKEDEENGGLYCEHCYEVLIAPSCAKCGLPITADCLSAMEKEWHTACFTCAHCRKPFGSASFYLEDKKPYCEQDWNHLFTTKCATCKAPIKAGQRWVEALGASHHVHCFRCSACHGVLEGQSFYAKDGHPFCKLHI